MRAVEKLALDDLLDRRARRRNTDLSDRILVLVANRLTQPSSEHCLARWLEITFACDRHGRRFVPAWRDEAERKASRSPRVRVTAAQLQAWYRSLDQLIGAKQDVEHQLYLRLRDLLSLRIDIAFYNLTSTYFEGTGPAVLGAHGYSRDHRPREPQGLVGLVIVDGIPIAHHVFAGNRRDASTVPAVLNDLDKRFGLGRVVFVGDRGMLTKETVSLLRRRGQHYLLGANRRRSPEASRAID